MKPNQISICLAYYEAPEMLAIQLANLCSLPRNLAESLELVVVDDGSPTRPAFPVFEAAEKSLVKRRLFRMRKDIPWNQDACRNLAAKAAARDWLLLTDMDHMPTEALLEAAVFQPLNPKCVYTFARVTAPAMTPYKPHPNSYLMQRTMYYKTGGYDERYAGVYGTDGAFRRSLLQLADRIVAFPEPLVRYPREVVPDASISTLPRKSEENTAKKKAVDAKIASLPAAQRLPVTGLTKWDRLI